MAIAYAIDVVSPVKFTFIETPVFTELITDLLDDLSPGQKRQLADIVRRLK